MHYAFHRSQVGFLQLISQTSAGFSELRNCENLRVRAKGRRAQVGVDAQLDADVENYVKNFKNIQRHGVAWRGVALKCLLFRVLFLWLLACLPAVLRGACLHRPCCRSDQVWGNAGKYLKSCRCGLLPEAVNYMQITSKRQIYERICAVNHAKNKVADAPKMRGVGF